MRYFYFLLTLGLFGLTHSAYSQIINTIAGSSGEAGLPTTASLNVPVGLAVDGTGNLYIADSQSSRIRRVNSTATTINTVAGNTSEGYLNDGVQAITAPLFRPQDVAVDANGNLYIVDTQNNRIRKVDAQTGIITTVAGNGMNGFQGDGSPATSARFSSPSAVAVDASGNLYICDQNNHRIRKVDAQTGIITTIAGSPEGNSGFGGDGGPAINALMSRPSGIALDGVGNLYITDSGNNRIRKVVVSTGIISTLAGTGSGSFGGDGGPATSASLWNPWGIATDAQNNVYIADFQNHRIRKITAATGIISTIAGTGSADWGGDGGPATAASLRFPQGIEIDVMGTIYIADWSNRVRKITPGTGIITTYAGGSGNGQLALNTTFQQPFDVALDAAGNLYIADRFNNQIRKLTVATGVVTAVAGKSSRGASSGDGGLATDAFVIGPFGVAVDGVGNIYFTEPDGSHRVRKVTAATGIISTVAGQGNSGATGDGGPASAAYLDRPFSVALDPQNNLYIADTQNNRIRKVAAQTGIITTVAGTGSSGFSGDGGPATNAEITFPGDVATDAAGNIYIAGNFRIRKVNRQTGIIQTVAGSGAFSFSGDGGPATAAGMNPTNVTVDANGNLFISDFTRIRRVDAATGIIQTIAGTGTLGFSGDGGPVLNAEIGIARGLAVTPAGILYIADTFNNRIRAVSPPCPVFQTIQSGNWNDPATWSCGRVPAATDALQIRHTVTLPAGFQGNALRISYDTGQRLIFGAGARLRLAVP